MDYLLWDNECCGFLSIRGNFTPVLHLAKRYTADNAASVANSLNGPDRVTIVPCRAPDPRLVEINIRRARGIGEDPRHVETADNDPAFFLWDNAEQCFVGRGGGTTRRCACAIRYSPETAMEFLLSGNREVPDRYVPLRAPPPGVALRLFNAAMMEPE